MWLHSKLPIDKDEKILAVYRHHWFAYATSWVMGVVIAVVILGVSIALTMFGGDAGPIAPYRSQVLAAGVALAVVIFAGSFVPVYLRSQEQLVLTEEAFLQVLQPSLFASKIDQVGLQHIADVSVRQDMFGTIFGYGHITIETPGEQNNYQFAIVPQPHVVAREVIQAHENYNAALQGGLMPSTLGRQVVKVPTIDPGQYQQFLAYQQMVSQQQASQSAAPQVAQTDDPTAATNQQN
jgi:uncharacterized membrane protein YdbT with pleckstrin-like domain